MWITQLRRWAPERSFSCFAALALTALVGTGADAQQLQTGAVARTFELRPRADLEARFEEGYRRHLDWHLEAGDPWPWYMWEVADGERAGLYVDGTFGHAWEDFDAAVKPAEDAADNARNVDPFVTRTGAQTWETLPSLGGRPVDREAARLVVRTEYRVRPEAEARFLDALGALRQGGPERPYAVFRLVSGGELPTYVLWAPAASWKEMAAAADLPAGVSPGDSPRGEAYAALLAATTQVRRELWRFRPDLSICRLAATRCHRTLVQRASGGSSPRSRPRAARRCVGGRRASDFDTPQGGN